MDDYVEELLELMAQDYDDEEDAVDECQEV